MPRKLGQHYLIKASILERIAAAACPDPEPLVVEIGPGKGPLTERLLRRAGRVVAIEVDGWLVSHLRNRFAGEPRLTVVHCDVLAAALGQWGPAVVAGNLPYYISTAILERVAAMGPLLRRGVFLLQKEVALRVTARAGDHDYGYLSVLLQLFADADLLFEVPPSAFHPPPKVDSAVVRLRHRDRVAELGIADTGEFTRFLSQCFRYKRKTLRNNLAEMFPKERLDALPEAPRRAEQLTIEQFAAVYRRLVS